MHKGYDLYPSEYNFKYFTQLRSACNFQSKLQTSYVVLTFCDFKHRVIFNKYKTFSVLIYSYINTSGNWKNEKLCGNTTPAGRSVFTQFRVFPIFTSVDITVYQYGKNVLYFFHNIAQRTLTEEWREIFRVDIELYQHGS